MTEAEKWYETIADNSDPERDNCELHQQMYDEDVDGFYHAGAEVGFTVFEDGSGITCYPCFGWCWFTAEEIEQERKEASEYDEYDG